MDSCFAAALLRLEHRPAAWATEHDYGPFDRLVIYKPLNSIYLNSVMARRFLSCYLVLWIDPQKRS